MLSWGETPDDAIAHAKDAAEISLAAYLKSGVPPMVRGLLPEAAPLFVLRLTVSAKLA